MNYFVSSIKVFIIKLFKLIGIFISRDNQGYEKIDYPLTGSEISPVQLAIKALVENDDVEFFFVQIGANDGIRADPIRDQVIQFHLKGILVEPLEDFYFQLKDSYKGEDQLLFENVAIAPDTSGITLYRFSFDAPVPDYAHGMATIDKETIQRLANKWGLKNYVEESHVPSITFSDLLVKHNIKYITLLQIDTEGFDFEIIKMVLKSNVLPSAINYEFDRLSPEDRLASYEMLSNFGYEFLHGRYDTLAVKKTSRITAVPLTFTAKPSD